MTMPTGRSYEQDVETPLRLQKELNEAIANVASAVVRYAAQVRSPQNPGEVLLAATTTIHGCVTSVIERIDPQSGKLRQFTPAEQQQMQQNQVAQAAELQALRAVAIGGAQGGWSGRGRGQRQRQRQQQQIPIPQGFRN